MPVPIIGYILSCAHHKCHVDDATDKLANLPCGKGDLQRYRSLSDTKLHKINKCVNKSVLLACCVFFFFSFLFTSGLVYRTTVINVVGLVYRTSVISVVGLVYRTTVINVVGLVYRTTVINVVGLVYRTTVINVAGLVC